MDKKYLAKILKDHKEWLANHENGQRANLRWADLRWADLQWADLRWADLRWANLRWADLRWADLRWANLHRADLQEANLKGANLQGANLQGANLQGANLQGANFDFSSWNLSCTSFHAKADDRLVSQLICHVTRLNTSNCSGGVKEAVDFIKKMAISDMFCEYRDDVDPLKEIE
jgi:uncharacterized protein YjbI with pentapeptide repeats